MQPLRRRDLVEIAPDGDPTLSDAGHALLGANRSTTVKHPIALGTSSTAQLPVTRRAART